jgi:hypothetical protein
LTEMIIKSYKYFIKVFIDVRKWKWKVNVRHKGLLNKRVNKSDYPKRSQSLVCLASAKAAG